ncbi:MAG: hypothetical protein IRZ31_00725 [Thermogemmatispora sp.]|uniref:hypothetical protein n=1 Tax=Thermogemmatispora sp. TaxID=1968838 RepID=UPI002614860C|nr:hypothetical protein [Thermogemmatispora sp.]MBX5455396.1 hypothetical protein [Thermogemmatispora sp.]
MERDSLVLGSLVFRTSREGLIVEIAERRYVLDSQHSRQLHQFLHSYQCEQQQGSESEGREHRLPLWVYAMHELG